MGVTIWLVPSKVAKEILRELKYQRPEDKNDTLSLPDGIIEFDPHITIIDFGDNLVTMKQLEMVIVAARNGTNEEKRYPGVNVDFEDVQSPEAHFYRCEILKCTYSTEMKKLLEYFADILDLDLLEDKAGVIKKLKEHGFDEKKAQEWKTWTKTFKKTMYAKVIKEKLYPHVSLMCLNNDLPMRSEIRKVLQRRLDKAKEGKGKEGFSGCIADTIMIVNCPDPELADPIKDKKREIKNWRTSTWSEIKLSSIPGLGELVRDLEERSL